MEKKESAFALMFCAVDYKELCEGIRNPGTSSGYLEFKEDVPTAYPESAKSKPRTSAKASLTSGSASLCQGFASPGGARTAIRAAARTEAPGRRQPRAAAAVATAGSGAPRKAVPGALRGSWSGQRGVGGVSGRVGRGGGGKIASGGLGREGEGAAEDRRSRRRAVGAGSRAGRGESCWRRGEGAEPEEGDAERACLAPSGPANVTVSLAERSHPLTLRLTRTLAPKPAPPLDRGVPAIVRRTPPDPQAGTYSCHLPKGQLSPSQQRPPPPPAASGSWHPPAWVRAGRPSPPPWAVLAVFTTFPPGQWRTPGDEPEGAGRRGVHASPAFFLQRTLYMVERGRAKVAPAPRLLPQRLRLPRRPPPPLCRGDHRTGIPPPVSPRRARRRRRGP
ncbi:unnamed protein product [Rangifer tarandus platyrhynchus]|uniref:Uncharacterized protein n=1 Tax=Rangifer tarandus platyrhynchus TaxID=3082113 RepID=A0ABN9A1W7_RANTA|nr:unnamed protein product [Rangifer tarandus platyrhynchus]